MTLLAAVDSVVGVPLADLTPWAVVSIVVLLIAWGKLIPSSLVRDLVADRDRWRESAQILADVADTLTDHHEIVVDIIQPLRDQIDRQKDGP